MKQSKSSEDFIESEVQVEKTTDQSRKLLEDNEVKSLREIVGPYGKDLPFGFTRLLTYLKKNKSEWSQKPPINLNTCLKILSGPNYLHMFQVKPLNGLIILIQPHS